MSFQASEVHAGTRRTGGRTDLPRQRGEDKRDSRQQQQQHVQGPCGQKELTHYEMYLERRAGRHRGSRTMWVMGRSLTFVIGGEGTSSE